VVEDTDAVGDADAANIPYDSPDHYAIAFSTHAAIESGHVDMHANSIDTPGVQGAQHKGSNEVTHEQCMRILRKFCASNRLTHVECGLTRFFFSDDRRNRLVDTGVLAPVAAEPFTDTFVDRALRLSAMLHDPSLVLINGARDIIVDAQSDWTLQRRDATTDFYSLEQSDEVSLLLPPTRRCPQPTSQRKPFVLCLEHALHLVATFPATLGTITRLTPFLTAERLVRSLLSLPCGQIRPRARSVSVRDAVV